MPDSIFEKIASRRASGFIVWEDEKFSAFLTINPLAEGHTLVVPKVNWGDYIFDLSDASYAELWLAAKKVAKLLESKISCDRVMVWVEGFEVPHVHIHLLPVEKGFKISEANGKSPSLEELAAIQDKILSE